MEDTREQLRVALCDDSELERARIRYLMGKSGIPFTAAEFTSGEDFLAHFEKGQWDLIFMDILLLGMNGVEATACIRAVDDAVTVVFTTSSTDYALDGYRHRVVRYLIKPVMKQDVVEAMEYARNHRYGVPALSITVRRHQREIPLAHITYLEQRSHTVWIHMDDGSEHHFTGKLSNVEAQLPDSQFLRTQISFIVNMAFIRDYDEEFGTFVLKSGAQVHIRREDRFRILRLYRSYQERTRDTEG